MKAVIFTTRSSYFQKHWRVLINHLDDLGYQIIMVSEIDQTYSSNDFKLSTEIKTINISISRSSLSPLRLIKECLNLKKILATEKPDIVHSFYLKSSFVSAIISLFQKSNYYFHLTGLGYIGNINNQLSGVVKKLILLPFYFSSIFKRGIILVETEYLRNFIQKKIKIPSNKVKVINGVGIDTEKFYAIKNKDFQSVNFIMVARLLRDKGILEYCSAAMKISNEFENISFALVGELDSENPNSINTNEFSQIIDSPVEYLGYSESIPQLLEKYNVFVLPSYFEGLSVSSLEAASCGLGLLLSDIPGCREIVCNGINGYTFERKSTIALYRSMKKIIENKEEISKFGINSRRLVEKNFSKQIVKAQLGELY